MVSISILQGPKIYLGRSPRVLDTMNTEVKQGLQRKYRVQVTVAIYRVGSLSYKSEILAPAYYDKRQEARDHIRQEIRERLAHSKFFRSTRLDYDLVRYTEEGSCNTYLRYSIQDSET